MVTYIMLAKFTEQGIKTVKESSKRRAAARDIAKSMGGSIQEIYLTMGPYDIVAIAEAPDDEAAAKLMLQIGMQGNLSTQTLRAFDESATDALLLTL
ncbi:MAG TPA: GYD domain-containing protein [Acidimicrobiales bacterium]|nr:GYD domain-containing protein [Acidimicrobiales bacterium]